MKQYAYKLLLILLISLGSLSISDIASAYWCAYGHCHHHYYHRYHNCRWVGGFWSHGYWHPRHRVCWWR